MSKMSELYTEMEIDFERLSATSMKWDKDTWGEQCKDYRFSGVINFDHKYVYWFDDYTYLIEARNILKEFDMHYAVIFDTVFDEWCITTPYESIEWRAN